MEPGLTHAESVPSTRPCSLLSRRVGLALLVLIGCDLALVGVRAVRYPPSFSSRVRSRICCRRSSR